MTAPVIETVYRCRIDWEVDNDFRQTPLRSERIADYAAQICETAGVELSDTAAGPCWNAYFVLESDNRENVLRAARQISAHIVKFRGGKILV